MPPNVKPRLSIISWVKRNTSHSVNHGIYLVPLWLLKVPTVTFAVVFTWPFTTLVTNCKSFIWSLGRKIASLICISQSFGHNIQYDVFKDFWDLQKKFIHCLHLPSHHSHFGKRINLTPCNMWIIDSSCRLAVSKDGVNRYTESPFLLRPLPLH